MYCKKARAAKKLIWAKPVDSELASTRSFTSQMRFNSSAMKTSTWSSTLSACTFQTLTPQIPAKESQSSVWPEFTQTFSAASTSCLSRTRQCSGFLSGPASLPTNPIGSPKKSTPHRKWNRSCSALPVEPTRRSSFSRAFERSHSTSSTRTITRASSNATKWRSRVKTTRRSWAISGLPLTQRW